MYIEFSVNVTKKQSYSEEPTASIRRRLNIPENISPADLQSAIHKQFAIAERELQELVAEAQIIAAKYAELPLKSEEAVAL